MLLSKLNWLRTLPRVDVPDPAAAIYRQVWGGGGGGGRGKSTQPTTIVKRFERGPIKNIDGDVPLPLPPPPPPPPVIAAHG